MSGYDTYENITRGILDGIKVGDLVKINDWKVPMKVKAKSKNYFVMTRKQFGETYYSVCEKIKWSGIRHNAMRGGMFHCGCDNWVFGSPLTVDHEKVYEFDNEDVNSMYLSDFESKETELSPRNAVPIYRISIKRVRK